MGMAPKHGASSQPGRPYFLRDLSSSMTGYQPQLPIFRAKLTLVRSFQHLHPLLLQSAALWAFNHLLATNITHRSRTVMVNGHLYAKHTSKVALADH